MAKVISLLNDKKEELSANTFIIYDEDNNCVIVDPSLSDNEIVDLIKKEGLNLKAILLTHGHFDHIRGVNNLVKELAVPFYISRLDEPLLTNLELNCSSCNADGGIIVKYKPILVDDNDIINTINVPIKVMATPYHTKGSVCFYIEKDKTLFSGDSLFKLFLGRDDLPTSVPKERNNSLKKLMSLPDEVIVYPGHGNLTSIGQERKRIKL